MTPLPDPKLPWPIPMAAVALVAEAEGMRLKAYRCPAGVWTIGRGRTTNVKPGDTCTQEQADQWLCDELTGFAHGVQTACTQAPTETELGAMTSLAYNIGIEGFRRSTVLKAHNAGNRQAAGRAFALWNKARVNGALVELPGLTARRAAEAALYLSTTDEPTHMPQAVEAETPLRQSTTIKGGTVIGGAGIVAGLGEAAGSLQGLGEPLKAAKGVLTETLGIPPSWILPLVLVVVAWVLLRDRIERRTEGWV